MKVPRGLKAHQKLIERSTESYSRANCVCVSVGGCVFNLIFGDSGKGWADLYRGQRRSSHTIFCQSDTCIQPKFTVPEYSVCFLPPSKYN